MAKLKKCRLPNCYSACIEDTPYCSNHQQYWTEEAKAKAIEIRARLDSLPKSNYYQSSEWKKLRAEALAITPYCTICGATYKLQVHHVRKHYNNPLRFFDINNLQVVCKQCHDKVSMRQVRGDTL